MPTYFHKMVSYPNKISFAPVCNILNDRSLHGKFFTRDCNAIFRNDCVAIAQKILQPGYMVLLQSLLVERFPEYSELSICLLSSIVLPQNNKHKFLSLSLQQDSLQNEKKCNIWSKMSYCMILYGSWELNEHF